MSKDSYSNLPLNIHNITSLGARNLIRGINDPANYDQTIKALKKIKNNYSSSDYKSSVTYLRTSSLFESSSFRQLFNKECKLSLGEVVEFEVKEICLHILDNAEGLEGLIAISNKILQALSKNDIASALTDCKSLIDQGGVSVFLIRTLFFMANRCAMLDSLSQYIDAVDSLKASISISRLKILEDAVSQLSNLRTSHLATYNQINELGTEEPLSYIVKSFIQPVPSNRSEYINRLSSLFGFSILDGFLFLESVNRTVYRVNGSRIERDPVFAKHQLKTLQGRFPVMDGAPLLRRLADGHE